MSLRLQEWEPSKEVDPNSSKSYNYTSYSFQRTEIRRQRTDENIGRCSDRSVICLLTPEVYL
jgi:hypothetical protein